MVAHLAQLHDRVVHAGAAALGGEVVFVRLGETHSPPSAQGGGRGHVAGVDGFVELALPRTQLTPQHALRLLGQLVQHLGQGQGQGQAQGMDDDDDDDDDDDEEEEEEEEERYTRTYHPIPTYLILDASEHKGSEHLVQSMHDQQLLLLRQTRGRALLVAHAAPFPRSQSLRGRRALGGFPEGGEGLVEPLVEGVHGGEDLRQQEVEQRPQLRQVVLQGRAREQHPMFGHVRGAQRLRELALRVLHAVALVHDDVLPDVLLQLRAVLHDVLVRRQQHVEIAVLHFVVVDLLAHVGRALVHHLEHVRYPLRELVYPVGERGERHDDEEGALVLLELHHVRQQRDGLMVVVVVVVDMLEVL